MPPDCSRGAVARGVGLGRYQKKTLLVVKPALDKVSFFVVGVPIDLLLWEAWQQHTQQDIHGIYCLCGCLLSILVRCWASRNDRNHPVDAQLKEWRQITHSRSAVAIAAVISPEEGLQVYLFRTMLHSIRIANTQSKRGIELDIIIAKGGAEEPGHSPSSVQWVRGRMAHAHAIADSEDWLGHRGLLCAIAGSHDARYAIAAAGGLPARRVRSPSGDRESIARGQAYRTVPSPFDDDCSATVKARTCVV